MRGTLSGPRTPVPFHFDCTEAVRHLVVKWFELVPVLSDQASFLPIIALISSRAVKGIYLRSSIAACKGLLMIFLGVLSFLL